MKNKKKILFQSLLFTFMFAMTPLAGTSTVYASNTQIQDSSITPYKDVINWVFKEEDGKLYKRLYNFSKGTWESDWVLISAT